MASSATATATMSSLTFPSLHLRSHPSSQRPQSSSKPWARKLLLRPITASVSERPYFQAQPPPPASDPPPKLPIRKIPGDYGLPIVGPLRDREDYFYNQGRDDFFKSRIQKYGSTVFRSNLPSGPFISSDTRAVMLLDGKSFPILFDNSKVEKKDLFTGTFVPSLELTGGYRVLSYLDPSEPNHGKLKQLMFFLLKLSRDRVIPEFRSSYMELFDSLEKEVAEKGKADFVAAHDIAGFNFLSRSLFGVDPSETKLGLDGPKIVGKWVLMQLSPLLVLGLPRHLENLLIHTFRLPPFLVKKDYQRLYDFFYAASGPVLDEAEKIGISREEACHNILFATCFNSFGGMKLFFPNVLKWIGRAGVKLHTSLAEEVRTAVKTCGGGQVTMAAMEQMPLMKSVVYECLRMEPPVPLQHGRAKRDLVIESHDAAFEVKEGEVLFGFQPFATKDPKIFDRAEEFVPERFVGEEGERLLKHVLWSNGPETENPTVANKQCAGKDFVVLMSRLLVVELFLRYDSFDVEARKSPLGASVTVTSLKRASF